MDNEHLAEQKWKKENKSEGEASNMMQSEERYIQN